VSSISEEIAIKALKYKSFVEESRVLIRKIKEEMIASLQRKGFCLSYTHFRCAYISPVAKRGLTYMITLESGGYFALKGVTS